MMHAAQNKLCKSRTGLQELYTFFSKIYTFFLQQKRWEQLKYFESQMKVDTFAFAKINYITFITHTCTLRSMHGHQILFGKYMESIKFIDFEDNFLPTRLTSIMALTSLRRIVGFQN